MSSKRYSAAAMIATLSAAAALLYCSLAKPSPASGLKHPEVITLEVRRIKAAENTELFGSAWRMSSKLDFTDAYTMKSDHAQFGGWSGLAFDSRQKHFVAVSDTGHWMAFDPIENPKEDSSTFPLSASIGSLLDTEGKPAANGGPRDIEAISIVGEKMYLSYESPSSGLYYSPKGRIDTAKFRRLNPLSPAFSALPKGYGLESIAAISPPGAPLELLAIAERPSEQAPGMVPAWLIQSADTQPQLTPLRVNNPEGYDISEIAWSSACGLFGIERKLTWYGRLKVKLVKLTISADRSSIESEALFSGDSAGSAIDNYEGLTVVDIRPGECDLYAISDDNFLSVQKTILMRFRYREAA
jgi:hypothetical protein